jgi:predicted RNase H-like HicB family nuclease
MRFRVEIQSVASGGFAVACADFPGCRAEAATRAEALEKIRRAIAFYEEMCPCDVTSEAGIELDVVDRAGR